MSVQSYRAAVVARRAVFDLLGPYRGRCEVCLGCPDARHREGDAITREVTADPAGEGPVVAVSEYLRDGSDPRVALAVAVAVLAADRRLHGTRLTSGRAAAIEREVYADVLGGGSGEAAG